MIFFTQVMVKYMEKKSWIYNVMKPHYSKQIIFFAILLALCYIKVPPYLEKFFWIY